MRSSVRIDRTTAFQALHAECIACCLIHRYRRMDKVAHWKDILYTSYKGLPRYFVFHSEQFDRFCISMCCVSSQTAVGVVIGQHIWHQEYLWLPWATSIASCSSERKKSKWSFFHSLLAILSKPRPGQIVLHLVTWKLKGRFTQLTKSHIGFLDM
jgi:hypothetical protein